MKQKLTTLYKTLLMIETKGESTKIMGECLKFTEELIRETSKNIGEGAVETPEEPK